MKKSILSLVISMAIMTGVCMPVNALENTAEVYVTIRDSQGKPAIIQEKIAVSDTDNNNIISIHDALYTAHEKFYQDGISGYQSEETSLGLSLTKLWGNENGGSYGYYLNDASPLSLSDEIKNGDYIDAYSYQDLTGFSDLYCYFEERTAQKNENEKFTITLLSASYDENWNPVTLPVSDAVITINGEKSSFSTNENGQAEISIEKSGEYIISAVSEKNVLVAPVCTVNIKEVEKVTETTAATTASTSQNKENPKTGHKNFTAAMISIMAGCAGVFIVGKKKNYEK